MFHGVEILTDDYFVLSQHNIWQTDRQTNRQNCDRNTVRCITCSRTVKLNQSTRTGNLRETTITPRLNSWSSSTFRGRHSHRRRCVVNILVRYCLDQSAVTTAAISDRGALRLVCLVTCHSYRSV